MAARRTLALGLLAAPLAAAAQALCERGRRQSPIDITATERRALPALAFDYRPAPLHADNDGHTVRVRVANGSRLLVGGQPHGLQQFHFHWPGGDRLNGEEFPLAMHWLHKSAAGQLVSLVMLLREGAEHAPLAALLPLLPGRGEPARVRADVRVPLADWVSADHGYYAYDGSLTGPPCTEGVRWLVMRHVGTVSPAQLAALHRLFPSNARPVQPLNGRVVAESL